MRTYTTIRNTGLAAALVATLAGAVSNGLAIDQRLIYERDLPEAAAVVVLPEVEVTLALLGERDVLGEMALLDESSTRSATATALTATSGLQCFRQDLAEAFRNESFVRTLVRLVQDRLRETNEQFRDRVTLEIPDRLLRQLLKLARTWGRLDQHRVLLRPRPTHEVLAQLIGCERETITRALKELQAAGLVSVEGQSLAIEDRAFRRLGIKRERAG
jgi:CRP-like cAMP-binding protein